MNVSVQRGVHGAMEGQRGVLLCVLVVSGKDTVEVFREGPRWVSGKDLVGLRKIQVGVRKDSGWHQEGFRWVSEEPNGSQVLYVF